MKHNYATRDRGKLIAASQRRIVAVARALEDPTRVTILRAIGKGNEWYGSRLADKVDITPSSVSRHMRVLRDAGLITECKQDSRVVYGLCTDTLEGFLEDIRQFFRLEGGV